MSVLVPCRACSRHIRNLEAACPFCGTAAEPSAAAPRELPARRLSRAALALASMTAIAGCGKETTTAAAYGGPPPVALDAEPPVTQAPAYGAPPMIEDAAPPPPTPPADAGTVKPADAGTRPSPNITHPPAPAYGGPPPSLKH
jgi:hypothetical protein